MNAARFFTIASLILGAAMIFLTPPFCAPDEPAHLDRAWSIARGHLIIHGGDDIPRSIVESAAVMLRMTRGAQTERVTWARLAALSRVPLNFEDTVFVAVSRDPGHEPLAYTAPTYSPIGYLAIAPAIVAGAALRLSPIVLVYLGRIANLLLATLLIGWAIRTIPSGRWTVALLSLTPMAVFMRSALGVDALTMAFVIALIAAILRRHIPLTLVLTFIVCSIKPGYGLLPLFAIAIPELRRRPAVLAGLAAAILAGTAVTALFIHSSAPSLTQPGNPRLTTAMQHPVAYAALLGEELRSDAALLAVETVADFGWLDAPAPLAFALLWIGGLVLMAAMDAPSLLSPGGRACSLVIAVAEVAALMTVFHITTPGSDFLRGLQGRYFLPLLPLVLLACSVRTAAEATKARIAQVLVSVAAVQSLWILATRYWI